MVFDVVVVGSINYDISVMTPRLPSPGETLLGTGHFFGPGGKGANQAVAVSRLGGSVSLIGRVGADEWGASLVQGLADDGVDVSAVDTDPTASTGVAVITIDQNAENTIVGSSGANMELKPRHIEEHAQLISEARVVLAQLEVPLDTVAALTGIVSGLLLLNPAPARQLPPELLGRVDVLIPNKSELSVLTGVSALEDIDSVVVAALGFRPDAATVVTMGTQGAALISGDETGVFPAFAVSAVDPTGAGDAFCGALAYSLARGADLDHSVRFATAAGAIAVSTRGAQAGMPHRGDVEALLGI